MPPLTGAGWAVAVLAGAAAGWLAAWWSGRRARARLGADFVAAVSHELRTPLAQIRLIAETLMATPASDEEREAWLAAVAREAQVLEDRIANVLIFAHGDGLGACREQVALGDLVEDVTANYLPVAVSRLMSLRARVEAPATVRGDAKTLRQALVNLLDNAIRFGPEGQAVEVELRRDGDELVIAVSDQGPGIPVSAASAVWLPFVRDGERAGTGLGLPVVRRVAAQHGGSARIVRQPLGTRVELRLPAVDAGSARIGSTYPGAREPVRRD